MLRHLCSGTNSLTNLAVCCCAL
uniref:Uncharacterized protein n=1 Tax=Anopheles christyi TaxID=43041 RepID=A0A182KIV8_9DIPT